MNKVGRLENRKDAIYALTSKVSQLHAYIDYSEDNLYKEKIKDLERDKADLIGR
jgi:hypothetical protein